MTPADQDKLFKELRVLHRDWMNRFTSGYVHGVSDEGDFKAPRPDFIQQASPESRLDEYALGYLTGFAVHRGPDVEREPWFGFIGDLVRSVKR
jgi:hypothetical protein